MVGEKWVQKVFFRNNILQVIITSKKVNFRQKVFKMLCFFSVNTAFKKFGFAGAFSRRIVCIIFSKKSPKKIVSKSASYNFKSIYKNEYIYRFQMFNLYQWNVRIFDQAKCTKNTSGQFCVRKKSETPAHVGINIQLIQGILTEREGTEEGLLNI